MREAVAAALGHLCWVLDAIEKAGTFVKSGRPDEKRDLQAEILKLLRARALRVSEGAEVGGGQSDIILPGDLVLENKVVEETKDVSDLKPDADWQARRCSIALSFYCAVPAVPARAARSGQCGNSLLYRASPGGRQNGESAQSADAISRQACIKANWRFRGAWRRGWWRVGRRRV
jgi:hypothetical protein